MTQDVEEIAGQLSEAQRKELAANNVIAAGRSTPNYGEYKRSISQTDRAALNLVRKGLFDCFEQHSNPLHEPAYTERSFALTTLGHAVKKHLENSNAR